MSYSIRRLLFCFVHVWCLCVSATITDPCASGPCKNGATCNPWSDGQSYSCTCPWGYLGARCEEG